MIYLYSICLCVLLILIEQGVSRQIIQQYIADNSIFCLVEANLGILFEIVSEDYSNMSFRRKVAHICSMLFRICKLVDKDLFLL